MSAAETTTPSADTPGVEVPFLAKRRVEFTERRYLDEPLTPDELRILELRLGRPLREWVRSGEGAFVEAGLDDSTGDADLREAVARFPILMERPILVRGSRARIGRPPEVVLDLL